MTRRLAPIVIAMTVLFTSTLPAQTSKWKTNRIPNQQQGAVAALSQPTAVKGEGQTTPSGIKYWDIHVGNGTPATKGYTVKLLYAAWVENGKEFANSNSDGKPTLFTVGAGQVIAGWEQGVEGMKPGGKRQIHIPPKLAYGAEGLPPKIPPNASLIFDIELLDVQ